MTTTPDLATAAGVLAELVALQNLIAVKSEARCADYQRRLPVAMDAARALVSAPPVPVVLHPFTPAVAWMRRTNVDAEWDAYDFSASQQPGFDVPLFTRPSPAQPADAKIAKPAERD